MGKKSRLQNRAQAKAQPKKAPLPFVARTFEGLANECDWVALRELVPSATAPLTIKGFESTTVQVGTLLPIGAPAMRRESGEVWAGLQVQHFFGDASREVAAVLLDALNATESGIYGLTESPEPGTRLQDIVTNRSLEVTVHEGFDWWLSDVTRTDEHDHALEHANEVAMPTSRLSGVEAAYWTSTGSKEHLRWVMPEDENVLLTALARLHVSGDDVIIPSARFVGMFRAHGLLAPVWDLPLETGPEPLEDAALAFKRKLDEALADESDLSAEVRSARAGLANRQVTIR